MIYNLFPAPGIRHLLRCRSRPINRPRYNTMVKSNSGTLIKPPPPKPNEAPIESVLALLPLTDFGPDIFTNTRPLWHPPGARGIYGGAAIAQSLAAAQLTIPPPCSANENATYLIHSMHCYFVLAGDAAIPIIYHVERVRDGKSFITRTVQARQRGKCIFTTTLSFVREGSAGAETVDHQADLPPEAVEALQTVQAQEGEQWSKTAEEKEAQGPFVAKRMDVHDASNPKLHERRTRQWIRARGTISPEAGLAAHLSAMAYMSDSYFIGTVSRVHGLWRLGGPAPPSAKPAPAVANQNGGPDAQTIQLRKEIAELSEQERRENPPTQTKRIGMMVSLDHTIYFHRPREVKADDWLFAEMSSPWAGDGRGVVFQRIWNKDGVHVASCVQEGLARLVQTKQGMVEEVGKSKI